MMSNFRYVSRFSLPLAEADFVCALAEMLRLSPDQAVCALIRWFARQNPDLAHDVWAKALDDHRGPWKPPR